MIDNKLLSHLTFITTNVTSSSGSELPIQFDPILFRCSIISSGDLVATSLNTVPTRCSHIQTYFYFHQTIPGNHHSEATKYHLSAKEFPGICMETNKSTKRHTF